MGITNWSIKKEKRRGRRAREPPKRGRARRGIEGRKRGDALGSFRVRLLGGECRGRSVLAPRTSLLLMQNLIKKKSNEWKKFLRREWSWLWFLCDACWNREWRIKASVQCRSVDRASGTLGGDCLTDFFLGSILKLVLINLMWTSKKECREKVFFLGVWRPFHNERPTHLPNGATL